MHERPEQSTPVGWDSDSLGTALRAPVTAMQHAEFGTGHLFLLGSAQATTLEVYPARGVVRVTGDGIELTLAHQEMPHLKSEGVIFTREHEGTTTRLLVASSGEVLLGISPTHFQEPLEGIRDAFIAETGKAPSHPGKPSRNDSAAPQHRVERPSPIGEAPGERKEQEYVVVRGRVGKAPTLRTTTQGTVVARFQINTAWEQEDEKAAWQQVVAFNKRAEVVQEKVTSGKVVEVRGYLHDRVRKLESGETKITHEIYLAAVKTSR